MTTQNTIGQDQSIETEQSKAKQGKAKQGKAIDQASIDKAAAESVRGVIDLMQSKDSHAEPVRLLAVYLAKSFRPVKASEKQGTAASVDMDIVRFVGRGLAIFSATGESGKHLESLKLHLANIATKDNQYKAIDMGDGRGLVSLPRSTVAAAWLGQVHTQSRAVQIDRIKSATITA